MIDLQALEMNDENLVFGYEKSKWKTDYTQVLSSNLNQLVRRSSCYCTCCGGQNKQLETVIIREILTEPIFPFIKSPEELECDKRIQKRLHTVNRFKRMQLEVFKSTILDSMDSTDEKVAADFQDLNPFKNIDIEKVNLNIEKLKKNSKKIQNVSNLIKTI